jgi:hypothetical protein
MAKNNYGDRLQNSALAIKKERPASMREFAFGTNYCWSLINANLVSHLGLTSFDLFHPNGKMRNFYFNYGDNLTQLKMPVKGNLGLFRSNLVKLYISMRIYNSYNMRSLR